MSKVTINESAIKRRLRQAVLRGVRKSCLLVQAKASSLAPGVYLPASIETFVDEQTLKGYVFTRLHYGPYVEYNTQPHIIKPKDKKALAFGKAVGTTSDGATMREHVVKEVHHPGTTAQPFMRPAVDTTREEIKKIIANEVSASFR